MSFQYPPTPTIRTKLINKKQLKYLTETLKKVSRDKRYQNIKYPITPKIKEAQRIMNNYHNFISNINEKRRKAIEDAVEDLEESFLKCTPEQALKELERFHKMRF